MKNQCGNQMLPATGWYFSFGLLNKSNAGTSGRNPRYEADEPQPATGRLEAQDPTHRGHRPIQLRRVDWVRLSRENGSSVTGIKAQLVGPVTSHVPLFRLHVQGPIAAHLYCSNCEPCRK